MALCTPGTRFRHTVPTLALVAAAALLPGCATRVPTVVSPAVDHKRLGRIAVLATGDEPAADLDGFPEPRAKADPLLDAGAGAATGAGACVVLLPLTFVGLFGPAGLAISEALLPPCAVAGTVYGAAAGAAAAQAPAPPDSGAAHQQANALLVQEALRRSVEAAMRAGSVDVAELTASERVAAAHNPVQLAARGIDTVLEVRVEDFGTILPHQHLHIRDSNPMSQISAAIRVLRTRDGAELYAAEAEYLGRWRKVEEWLADQGRPLIDDLRHGIDELGRTIYEDLFAVYHFPDRQWCPTTSRTALPRSHDLAPLDPPVSGTVDERAIPGSGLEIVFDPLLAPLLEAMDVFDWTTVANHQPLLAWEEFPRESDRISAAEDMARVTDVRYELLIAREEGLGAAEIVYRRDRIATPEHVVEQPLSPNGRFFWSVRARFALDGHEHVTEWGSRMGPSTCRRATGTEYLNEFVFVPYQLKTTPSVFSYRFKTGP